MLGLGAVQCISLALGLLGAALLVSSGAPGFVVAVGAGGGGALRVGVRRVARPRVVRLAPRNRHLVDASRAGEPPLDGAGPAPFGGKRAEVGFVAAVSRRAGDLRGVVCVDAPPPPRQRRL